MKADCTQVLPQLRADFGRLWHCRQCGSTIEIVTPFSTATDRFVSVFVTLRGNSYITTDGGWLERDAETYGVPFEAEELQLQLAIDHFASTYGILRTEDKSGRTYYFKKAERAELLSNAVYDLASFVAATVNTLSVPKEVKEEADHKETFRAQANGFLKSHFSKAEFRKKLPDLYGATFSVVITRNNRLSLVNYVTGSTPHYVTTDLRRAIVNFELATKSKYHGVIRSQVALINNEAEGYNPLATQELLTLLAEKTTHEPVLWTDRQRLLGLV